MFGLQFHIMRTSAPLTKPLETVMDGSSSTCFQTSKQVESSSPPTGDSVTALTATGTDQETVQIIAHFFRLGTRMLLQLVRTTQIMQQIKTGDADHLSKHYILYSLSSERTKRISSKLRRLQRRTSSPNRPNEHQ
ncbi:uncharacterized protein LOC134217585 [Armigeres subalbatus]|uniref:uncharacterized protein LOC134217585 n=1 Tax=Armigeres subalbatus TaxID=124917 RepID=UPI002ED20C8D